MCGIAGIRRFGDEPIQGDQLRWLLCSLEWRGNDAAGVALMTEGRIQVLKTSDTPWQFAASEELEAFFQEHLTPQTTMALVHTRAATVGSPKDLNNNHPMWAGKCAVVHNGGVVNHEWIFDKLKLERKAETDSDVIRAIVDKFGLGVEAIKELNRLSGGVAAGIISEAEPEKMLILKSGSPLVLASTEGQLLFASTKEALVKATKIWDTRFNIPMMANRSSARFITMPGDTAWLIGPKGKENHWEFKTANYYGEPNRQTYTKFKERKKRWEKEPKKEEPKEETKTFPIVTHGEPTAYAPCRNPECVSKETGKHTVLVLKGQQIHKDRSLLRCPECKWTLREERK